MTAPLRHSTLGTAERADMSKPTTWLAAPIRRRRKAGRTALWVAVGVIAACLPLVAVAGDDTPGLSAAPLLPAQRVELPWRSRPALTGNPPQTTVEIDTRSQAALNPPAVDGPTVNPASAPAWNDPGQLGVHVVRWAAAGPSGGAVGLSLGFSGAMRSTAAPTTLMASGPVTPLRPELGVRWRSGWSGQHRVDVAAWRSDAASTEESADEHAPAYNARVELQFRDAKHALGFDLPQGALGLQMQGGGHLMLRARHGGPMLYYRRQW